MPVEVTNRLTPEMQEVSDCREAVRNAEADVEEKKTALKLSKAALEAAQEELNASIDRALDAQRQPTLFDRFGGDDLTNPPVEPPPGPEGGPGAGDLGGEILDAEYEVNPPGVASLPAASGLVPVGDSADTGNAAVEDGRPDDVSEKAKGKRRKAAAKEGA